MSAGLGFIVQAILGTMGSPSFLHVQALYVRLSEAFLVLMAVCSVRSLIYVVYHYSRAKRASAEGYLV